MIIRNLRLNWQRWSCQTIILAHTILKYNLHVCSLALPYCFKKVASQLRFGAPPQIHQFLFGQSFQGGFPAGVARGAVGRGRRRRQVVLPAPGGPPVLFGRVAVQGLGVLLEFVTFCRLGSVRFLARLPCITQHFLPVIILRNNFLY